MLPPPLPPTAGSPPRPSTRTTSQYTHRAHSKSGLRSGCTNRIRSAGFPPPPALGLPPLSHHHRTTTPSAPIRWVQYRFWVGSSDLGRTTSLLHQWKARTADAPLPVCARTVMPAVKTRLSGSEVGPPKCAISSCSYTQGESNGGGGMVIRGVWWPGWG